MREPEPDAELAGQGASDRRLRTLRALAARSADAATVADACRMAAAALGENPVDLPFVLIYLVDNDGSSARLAGAAGIETSSLACPQAVPLDADTDSWPLARARRRREAIFAEDLERRFGRIRRNDEQVSPSAALVLPLPLSGEDRAGAFLVAGLSARVPVDDAYRGFLELVGVQLGAALTSARGEARRQACVEGGEVEIDRAARFSELLVGVLGHDLRNPLGAIAVAANLLEVRAESERIARPVSRILASAERMDRMISQLLDFARIRLGGGISLKLARVDLADLCRSKTAEEERAEERGMRVESRGNAVGAWDADRLSQVLANLLDNACRHGTPGIPILVRIDGTERDVVRLEVHSGGSISPSLLPLVFEPPDAPVRPEKGDRSSGLGLGLYITREIARAHGGGVRVESNGASGTRFVVNLPRDRSIGVAGEPGASFACDGKRSDVETSSERKAGR